ncbi:DegT/DnrJ/EryC1/StrS family aminotransferase, partial [Staphylococcus aureus]
IATAQAIVAAKAIPIFVDVNPRTFCIDTEKIEEKITPKTSVIMPVHVHGLPADLLEIQKICDKYQLKLVEDASHAHSAKVGNKMCGSIGDAAGQSLMADKNFPVGGEGGIVFFKKEEYFRRAKDFLETTQIDYQMSWIAAAFGISQLDRLGYYDKIRQRNANILIDELKKTRLFSPPFIPINSTHSFNMFRFHINVNLEEFNGIENFKIKEAIQTL